METNRTLDFFISDVQQKFEWPDYLSFCIMLALSGLIGIYFGFWGKEEDSRQEYSHGGMNMSIFPITASLTVSLVSAIAILGIPSEIYMYGILFWWICLSAFIAGVLNDFFYLPVFYELRLASCYEYLDLRFDKRVRFMASFINSLQVLLFMPLVIYVPALVVSQVSALELNLVTPVITIICIAYTVLGGIKAVVWTDLLQAVVILGSMITVLILGISHVGGFQTLWERNYEGGRLQFFVMNPSPFERTTFWTVTVGLIVTLLSLTTNQPSVQRYNCLPTIGKARLSIYLFMFGLLVIYSISTFLGLILYAEYFECDLLKSKKISKPDEMIIYYVMQISAYTPGLPGLFVAGVVSAALSTLSSSLNSISLTVFEDFISPWVKNRISDTHASYIMKLIALIFGAVCLGLSFVVGKLGLIAQLGTSLNGVTTGTVLGIFSLGIFFPRANHKGALTGGIISLVVTIWLVMGAQIAIAERKITYETLPTTAVGCGYNDTTPNKLESNGKEDDVFILYKLSFTYFSLTGFLLVIIIGLPVSYLTEPPKSHNLKPVLFAPIIRKYLMRTENYNLNDAKEMELMNINS